MQLQVAAYSARSCRLQTSDGGSLSGRGGSARGLRELIGYRAEIVDGVANLGRVRVRVRVRIGVGVRVRVRVGVSSGPAAWAHARASSREMACPLTFHVRKAASMTRRVAVSVVEVRLGGAESGTMRSPPIWGTAPGLPRPGL